MYILIVNPTAGNGKGLKVIKSIQKHPLFEEKDCRSFFSKYEGHAEELVKQVVEIYNTKIKCILVVGGDGTLHEVLNGLKLSPKIPLAFIPAGSGNDFARGTKTNKKPLTLFADMVKRPSTKPYWVGMYRTDNRKKQNSRLFGNNIGFGFDAEVALKANASLYKKWLNKFHLGSVSYVIALVHTLYNYSPKTIELTLDGESKTLTDVFMVTIGIHGYYGGGMKIIPNVTKSPDKLDILVIQNISKWKVLALFLSVFWGGHTRFKEVKRYQAKSITISGEEVVPYHVDGQPSKCHKCSIEKENQSRNVYQYRKLK